MNLKSSYTRVPRTADLSQSWNDMTPEMHMDENTQRASLELEFYKEMIVL